MVSLVVALMLLGILLGAVAHIPVFVSVLAGSVIGCWLIVFLVREQLAGRKKAGI